MSFKTFYYCESTNDRVDAENAIEVDRDTLINIAMQILREEGDFIGVTSNFGCTLQFMVSGSGSLTMEIPSPENKESYAKEIHVSEIEDVLIPLKEDFCKESFSGMNFVSW